MEEVSMAEAVGVIKGLLDQIGQMRAMFDDKDRAIASTTDKAEEFLRKFGANVVISREMTIGPWDSARYGHEGDRGPDCRVVVKDHLASSGRIDIDLQMDGSEIDDTFSVVIEVGQHHWGKSNGYVPTIHLLRGESTVLSAHSDVLDKIVAKLDTEFVRIESL